jgi:transposase
MSSLGYKVHFTQTCDDEVPQLITHVETTAAPLSDEGVVAHIPAELARKDLLPEQHVVDSGYVTVDNLVQSQADGSKVIKLADSPVNP